MTIIVSNRFLIPNISSYSLRFNSSVLVHNWFRRDFSPAGELAEMKELRRENLSGETHDSLFGAAHVCRWARDVASDPANVCTSGIRLEKLSSCRYAWDMSMLCN